MDTSQQKPETIDAYIASFPEAVQERLQAIRQTIRQTAPEVTEAIAYQMPAFKLHGNLVYFAAFKNHIGFYPMPSAMEAFSSELADYASSKGTVQFPHNLPIPHDLIARIVAFRVQENLEKSHKKRKQAE